MPSVLDTSALARLFLEDDGYEELRGWFTEAVAKDGDLLAPGLARYELGRVVERELDGADVPDQDHLLQLLTRALRIEHPATIRVFDLARAHQLTFYDASFVALADRLDAELVSFDRRMLQAARDEGLAVRTW